MSDTDDNVATKADVAGVRSDLGHAIRFLRTRCGSKMPWREMPDLR